MNANIGDPGSQFGGAVRDAIQRRDVHAAVRQVYRQLQAEIDQRRPICQISGRCCRFDEYGHRLYVTTAEMALFISELPPTQPAPVASAEPGVCPFQINRLCSVHQIRPFGCRIFFCDSTATDWQHEQYERFHGQLKQIHADFDIPYFYLEWRQALVAVGLG